MLSVGLFFVTIDIRDVPYCDFKSQKYPFPSAVSTGMCGISLPRGARLGRPHHSPRHRSFPFFSDRNSFPSAAAMPSNTGSDAIFNSETCFPVSAA